jgi:pilus assembly protein CpaE
MRQAHILVVEDSETTLLKLKVVLGYFGYHVTTYSNPVAALDWLMETQQLPDLILSDVLMPGLSGIEFTQKVRGKLATSKIPIVLLSADDDAEFEVAGRKAGADEYLNKMLSAAELTRQIKTILESQPTPTPQSILPHRMITVFSLRGGVGTTSLAVNLAVGLKQLWGGDPILWDMALSGGHCGLMLNLDREDSAPSWIEGLVESKQSADWLRGHDSGIKVMLAPSGLTQLETIPRQTMEDVIAAVRNLTSCLIVDGGNHISEALRPVLLNSDKILMALSPDISSIKSANDAKDCFVQLGIDPAKVEYVLNHTIPQHALSVKNISGILGKSFLAEIPYDGQNFPRAISSRKPLLTTAQTSESGWALLLLAYQISKKDMEVGMEDYSTPLLTKVRQLEWENEIGLVKW